MITKKDKHAIVNVFITPYAGNVKNVMVEVEGGYGLVCKVKPSGKINEIEAKKQ